MPDVNDIELLAQFARENSEAAFATLVGRHLNLVYSVALRCVGNPHAAEEITQAVFIILAKKARSLSAKTVLAGWLCQTARLTAANYLRTEIRRQNREQEAHMQSTLHESANDLAWKQIAPHLDEAVSKLRAKDRDALILRYFENKNLREIGAALGVEERAAQKRVNRAVEKLRSYFSKRGIGLTTAILAGVISANSVHAAPIGLVTTITVTTLKGSTVAASTLTLVKGTMKMMMWTKLKFAIGLSAAILLAAGTTTVVISRETNPAPELGGISANTNTTQILIQSKFFIVPDKALEDAHIQRGTALVDASNADAIIANLAKSGAITNVSNPRVVTISGNGATISVTKNVVVDGTNATTGTILNVTPTTMANSSLIELNLKANIKELTDTSAQHDTSQLDLETTDIATTVEMKSGQTVILIENIQAKGRPVGTDTNEPRSLLVFVTCSLVAERWQPVNPSR